MRIVLELETVGTEVFEMYTSKCVPQKKTAVSPFNLCIYEYKMISPIPVLAGDILGVFRPQVDSSQLALLSEKDKGPLAYIYSLTTLPPSHHTTLLTCKQCYHFFQQCIIPMVTVKLRELFVFIPKWFVDIHTCFMTSHKFKLTTSIIMNDSWNVMLVP